MWKPNPTPKPKLEVGTIDFELREKFVLAMYENPTSIEAAVKAVGISRDSGYRWVKEQWYKDRVDEIRHLADKSTERHLSRLLGKAIKELEDRIDNGDPRYVPAKYDRMGNVIQKAETVKVPQSSHTLAIVAGVLFDKRDKLRSAPQEAKDGQASMNQLERIADKLKSTMEKQLKKRDDQIIDVDLEERRKTYPPRQGEEDGNFDPSDEPIRGYLPYQVPPLEEGEQPRRKAKVKSSPEASEDAIAGNPVTPEDDDLSFLD